MYIIVNQIIGVALAAVAPPKPNPIPDITSSGNELKNLFTIQSKTPNEITSLIFSTILGIAGLVFMIMMLVGGFAYLTGAGNEEKTGKAKKLMVDAVIGVILTASAYGISQFIIGQLSGK